MPAIIPRNESFDSTLALFRDPYEFISKRCRRFGAELFETRLLRSHREHGVHLKASWIFTINDTIASLGIVVSGVAVMILKSRLPDLLIGLVVVGIVLNGGWEILEHAREAQRAAPRPREERG